MSTLKLPLGRHKIEPKAGVYFLLLGDEVVYIGKSINIWFRVMQHVSEGAKIFDSFSFVEAPIESLDIEEAALIVEYAPRYNSQFPLAGEWITFENLASKADYSRRELRQYLREKGIELRACGAWTIVRKSDVQRLLS